MTMPHLMNCQHSDSGWCLECVGKLQKRYDDLDSFQYCQYLDNQELVQFAETARIPINTSKPKSVWRQFTKGVMDIINESEELKDRIEELVELIKSGESKQGKN